MNENPSVNRSLTDKAIDRIDHALGRPVFPLRPTYRNYFATEVGGVIARQFAASPNWQLGGRQGDMLFFHVTDVGKRALVEYLVDNGDPWRAFEVTYRGHRSVVSASSPATARYHRFLDLVDVLPDLTFREFLRESAVRRAS